MLFPDSTNLTDFRDHLTTHLRRLQGSKRPMLVTQRGKVRGVMLSPEQYEELSEAVAFRRLMESIDQGARGEGADAIKFLESLSRSQRTRPAKAKRATRR